MAKSTTKRTRRPSAARKRPAARRKRAAVPRTFGRRLKSLQKELDTAITRKAAASSGAGTRAAQAKPTHAGLKKLAAETEKLRRKFENLVDPEGDVAKVWEEAISLQLDGAMTMMKRCCDARTMCV